ncbi:cobaltochelatase subunit CobS [Enterovibrio norvegicus]|uniref:AAA family ATPase n=1 Tax=Enterovibrio norvegicus TaxID=188144 RepID=UPI0003063355|nr:AAA family ATPase [Enterovibrio norvegicus]OEE60746.1 cobaltochelatase subunit CobS [Enterovibrio norvegicus]TKF15247.1 cobaltochelatase subunit CobS [Enterovibrio norvegicus]
METEMMGMPDIEVCVRDMFGIDSDLRVPAYSTPTEFVPDIDPKYVFNPEVTLAILAGFSHNRRTLVQGMHGTGKSTHIEQVAARLNWPCLRINLDGHISRLDLVGKDTLVLRDGKQVTEFQDGLLPWSVTRPIALVLDEYDAGRPDVMFVIQRLLEKEGKLTLSDKNRVLTPHAAFRLFATANTVGLGNLQGLYHGTHALNHAQIDRWNLVVTLNYLAPEREAAIVLSRVPTKNTEQGQRLVSQMVALANLTRRAFANGDTSTLMSPRTVIMWAENHQLFPDVRLAFRLTFLNKCDESEWPVFNELYQRCFDEELIVQSPLFDSQSSGTDTGTRA